MVKSARFGQEFRKCADRFRRMDSSDPIAGDRNVRLTAAKAAKLLKRAADRRLVELPDRFAEVWPASPGGMVDEEPAWCAAWTAFVVACEKSGWIDWIDLPPNLLVPHRPAESADMTQMEYWQARAEAYAEVCNWLARRVDIACHRSNPARGLSGRSNSSITAGSRIPTDYEALWRCGVSFSNIAEVLGVLAHVGWTVEQKLIAL